MDNTTTTIMLKDCTDEQQNLFTQIYEDNRKSKSVAYILLCFLGLFGLHKFYLNKSKGWFYTIFCWTTIPSIICFIELFTLSSQVDKFNNDKAQEIIMLIKVHKESSAILMAVKSLKKNNMISMVCSSIVGVLVFIIFSSAITNHNTSHVSTNADNYSTYHQDTKTNTEPTINISAQEIYSNYTNNEVSADNTYKGNIVAITGKVSDIHKLSEYTVLVALDGDGYGLGSINCEMSVNAPEVHSINNGALITLVGEVKGDGLTLGVIQLKDGCYIKKK